MRKRCGLTRHRSNGHCKVRSLNLRVKCDYSVQRIVTSTNNLTASKQVTITLLDLLHLSRNKCVFFLNTASNVGMLHRTWWVMTTNTHSPRQAVIELCIQNYRPHAIFACMTFWNSTIIVMRTWTYIRNEKVHFNCIWTSGEEARSLIAAQYFYRSCLWMSLSSGSSVSSTAPRYLYWLTDFRFLPPMCQ